MGDAGRADGDGRSAGGRCRRLRPASHSLGPDVAFSGADDLRADRGRAARGRPFPPDQVRGSKRQVVRLLTAKLDLFRAEEDAVFSAGLRASAYVSVDDTGPRHAGKACFTTQFGSDRFTVFRTGPSKSRLAFLRNLLGGTARYAVNATAAAYLRAANLAHGVIDALMGADLLEFGSEADWTAHLAALGLTEMRVAPNPVRVASEAALWGAIAAQDRLGSAIILSHEPGQIPGGGA